MPKKYSILSFSAKSFVPFELYNSCSVMENSIICLCIELFVPGYYPVNMDDYPLLYPFGPDAGDTSHSNLGRDDSYTPRINLVQPIVFFGDTFDHIYVRKLK